MEEESGSKLIWVPDARHTPMIEKPEAFNKALEEFISGQTPMP